MGGALPEAELVEVLRMVGLTDVRIGRRFRSYDGTTVDSKLGHTDVDVQAVNVFARKPR